MDITSRVGLQTLGGDAPHIERALQLHFSGDWGQGNFHRICSWLTQEVCERAGPSSTVAIKSYADGGIGSIKDVYEGRTDLALFTPAAHATKALTGEGTFTQAGPMPTLRALATLPQTDRMVLAVHPKYKVKTWEDIHKMKPPLRIVQSTDDGTCWIGYHATQLLKEHGLTKELLESWGGEIIFGGHHPNQTTDKIVSGEGDCLVQEAIMTPWWRNLIENGYLIPIPAENSALDRLSSSMNLGRATLRAGYWNNVPEEIPAMEYSDFTLVVRNDMPNDLARLLAWIIINTRSAIEQQYRHIPAERSPLTWPLEPSAMIRSSLPLHDGAKSFYEEAGLL